jgi:uncharacterized protein involved in exopolysaccharide biosynthesis
VTRHLETFFRHKLVLLLPILVAVVAATWFVSTRPSTYSSTTTVWFDSPLPNTSSIDQSSWNAPVPATQANSLMQQLLKTRAFLIKVGHRGPVGRGAIANYIIAKQQAKGGTKGRLTNDEMDDLIVRTLSPALSSVVVGNQVIQLNMTGQDPAMMRSTLDAVVAQYFEEVTATRQARLQAVVGYYEPLLADAAKDVERTRGEAVSYVRTHPEAAFTVTDPAYNALAGAASGAQAQYQDLEQHYSEANHALALADASMSSKVIDPAGAPKRASTKKKAIFAEGAAVMLGALVSVIGIAALTALDTTARLPEDMQRSSDGLRLIGTIGSLEESDRRRRTGAR